MIDFLSGAWDFIVWLFPWVVLGIGLGSYHSGIGLDMMRIASDKDKAREYLFIATAISIIAGIVTPIFLQTTSYWTAPLVFWSGFLFLLAVVVYNRGGYFWEGIFGLGMASITQYVFSFYNEANPILLIILRFFLLLLIFFTGIKFAQFLNSVTKQGTKKTPSKSHKPEVVEAEINQKTEKKEIFAPQKAKIDKDVNAKDSDENSERWKTSLQVIASFLGILLLLLQLTSQALDVLQKIP